MYTPPDPQLAERSFGTLLVCGYDGDLSLVVVDVKTIVSVISMIPFTRDDRMMENPAQFFVVEKPGLDFAIAEDDIDAD
jgi:hypothetical protein